MIGAKTLLRYDLKVGLSGERYVQQLYLTFGDEASFQATVFRRRVEFCAGDVLLRVTKKHRRRPSSAVTPRNVFVKGMTIGTLTKC